MIERCGYQDDVGEYYITICTTKCLTCSEKPCVPACPKSLFKLVQDPPEDPYGEEAVTIAWQKRKHLKHECSGCKPIDNRPALPCTVACPFNAITHSW